MVFMSFMVFSDFSIVVTCVSSFSLMFQWFIYVCLSFIMFIGFSIAVECFICVPSFSIHCSMVLACFFHICSIILHSFFNGNGSEKFFVIL